MHSRRDFGKVLLAAMPMAAQGAINSKIGGVQIGVISYSFRSVPSREIIPAMVKIGLGEVELMSVDAETLASDPVVSSGAAATERLATQESLGQWRAAVKPEAFRGGHNQFTDAGIDLRILCYNMGVNIDDTETDYAFRMAQALGVRVISSSATLAVAKRVAPFADKYKIVWAAHGHDNVKDPEQFATPEVFGGCVRGS